MRLSSSLVRPLALVLLVVSVAGCSWFKKGARGDYALAPEARPLEVPPDLTLPNTSGAMQIPAAGQATPAAAPAGGGFNVAGSRDDAFARVGEAPDFKTLTARLADEQKSARKAFERVMKGLG